LCLFCVVVHLFWLVNVCFCCVRFSFSLPSQEIGLGTWGTSLKWSILCQVGHKALTQSIKCNFVQKVLFLVPSVMISLWFFVRVWNISATAERICAKFTWKTCLIPRSDEFESQGHQGQKTAFSALSAVCVQFKFGKTSLASGFQLFIPRHPSLNPFNSHTYYLLITVTCYVAII